MSKTIITAFFLTISFIAFGQAEEEVFVKVFVKTLNEKDSSAITASVLYEKLPYYDDMGMGTSGTDGEAEFFLIKDVAYNFSAKKTDYNPSKQEVTIRDEDGDGSFAFTMYLAPGEEIELITLENLIFARGSDRITESSNNELDELVSWLESKPNTVIQLEGHTDFAGNADANMRLSQARVEAVKEYLTKKGVKKSRVLTKAFGGTQPLTTERTDEAKTKNRRVEVRVIRK
ncbi:MAG: OmpA family protein [Cyclobacteriaceae bacterium]